MNLTALLPPARAFFENPESCFHLLDALPLALAVFTPDGGLIFANRACLALDDSWQARAATQISQRDAQCLFPLNQDGRTAYLACWPSALPAHTEPPEIVQAKQYIADHWREAFVPAQAARALNISVRQLYSLFQKHTTTSPGEYHKQCLVEHIKQKLADPTLMISEAFAACGQDSRGWISRVFKQATGLSPRKYRARL